jgi:hypothetical protein
MGKRPSIRGESKRLLPLKKKQTRLMVMELNIEDSSAGMTFLQPFSFSPCPSILKKTILNLFKATLLPVFLKDS